MGKIRASILLKNQRGQALLIVVLVMVVALTVGLSVVSRTITNLRNTSEQESSQKALAAAEAGVERAIKANTTTTTPIGNSLGNQASYSYTVTQVSGAGAIAVNGGSLVNKNDGIYVWLVSYSPSFSPAWSGNTLTIYWGSPSDVCTQSLSTNTMAALEVEVVSGTKANPTIRRMAFDPCAARTSGVTGNNFSAPNSTTTVTNAAGTFHYTAVISGISNGILVKLSPLYASTKIGVQGNVALPSQGNIITSTGTVDNAQRKITVFQSYPELPSELFPYTLFSP
jgi:Tfp pilus assembly protein PilX